MVKVLDTAWLPALYDNELSHRVLCASVCVCVCVCVRVRACVRACVCV